ncbi:phage terminase large subunit [Amycolatopsis pigmentata]|uniref:Phage terminase large subunit n=1 Tax=Amycolatopsis pigmentata TaxID=450801 RepID=A0ABW5G4W3_9PSEU
MDALTLAAQMLEESAEQAANPQSLGELATQLDAGTVQTPALDLLDEKLAAVASGDITRLIWSMPPQEGKALALDTPIATPAGWTTMGDLRVGDQVFDRHGKPCKVTWTSPTWRDRPCYVVRTGDGESIVADAEHEWVARLDRRRGERLCTTELLAGKRSKNAQIIGAPGLDLPEVDLPLDPYVLGAWLGDGHSKMAMITSADIEIVDRIRAAGVPCRKTKERYAWTLAPEGNGSKCSPVRKALNELGLIGNKHVPDAYMRGSTAQRLALLQGLVDTDGYVSPKGQVEFTSTRRRLAFDVQRLVYSLGAKATLSEGRATINGRDCGPKYRVKFYLADAAWLPRKAANCKDSSVARVRYVWAEPCESVPTRCIEVDSPDHTYLAGSSLLPTHNSERVSRRFPAWVLSQRPDTRIAIASYELGVARRWGRAIRNDIAEHPELGLKVRADTSAAHEWQLEGHKGGVYSVGIGGALTGRPVDLLLVDDPIKGRAEADSEVYREACWDWWTNVARTRLAPGAPVVLILTRWHEDDLAGRLIKTGDWEVVNVPAEAEGHDPLGRTPGQYLQSARGRDAEDWKAIRKDVGERVWGALYQGRPAPAEGALLKRSWWRYYHAPQWRTQADGSMKVSDEFDQVIQSWDMTFKDTKGTDYVIGQVWARRGPDVYLLDQVRDRMDFPTTCRQLLAMTAKWPQSHAKLVEDKANGSAVISQLSSIVGGLIAVTPKESKQARASAVSPYVESGNVYLPDPRLAPWIAGFVEECAAFPNGTHDDQVDGMSQALDRLLINASSAAAFLEALSARR